MDRPTHKRLPRIRVFWLASSVGLSEPLYIGGDIYIYIYYLYKVRLCMYVCNSRNFWLPPPNLELFFSKIRP